MGSSRQEYWCGLPCPPPGNFPNPGIKPTHVSVRATLAKGGFSWRITVDQKHNKTCSAERRKKDDSRMTAINLTWFTISLKCATKNVLLGRLSMSYIAQPSSFKTAKIFWFCQTYKNGRLQFLPLIFKMCQRNVSYYNWMLFSYGILN